MIVNLRCLIVAAACCMIACPAIGSVVQPLIGAPTSYVPGQPVSFNLTLPGMSNLGAYDIDLILESATGAAGIDFFFDVNFTQPSSVNYIFSSGINYFDAAIVDEVSMHVLTLTDFEFAGVDVVTDVNDQVATVVVNTLPTYRGMLKVWVNSSSLILDATETVRTPVADFADIQLAIANASPIVLAPVPEPSGVSIVASGVGILCAYRRRWTKAHLNIA